MAESKKESLGKGLDHPEEVNRPVVQSTTTETPAEADKSSAPNANDAKTEDPPVRTSRPDVDIAQTLAAGAGEHRPPDPDVYDPQGRMYGVTAPAKDEAPKADDSKK